MAEMQDAKQNYAPWLTLPKHFSVCYLNIIVTFKVTSSAYFTTNLLRFSRTRHKFIWLTPKQCFALIIVTVLTVIHKLTCLV